MLQDKFFSIVSFNFHGQNNATAVLNLNRESPVFQGHFPDNPVVPGVCSVQIIQELAERMAGRKLKLVKGDNIKFLGMINPDETPEINSELSLQHFDDNRIFVNALLSGKGKPFTKFAGDFI
jgi:3-hydroxyacyl-[acyl-carrier-protein] dehydratase